MAKVQGYASTFFQTDVFSILRHKKIDNRVPLTDLESITFIDNTNLHKVESACKGCLVAYSTDNIPQESYNKVWFLGIIVFLHPELLMICNCQYDENQIPKMSNSIKHLHPMQQSIDLKYLNLVTDCSVADDGLIECDIHGPDVPIKFPDWPPRVKDQAIEAKKITTSLWTVNTSHYSFDRRIRSQTRNHKETFLNCFSGRTNKQKLVLT